jgi:fibronectin type 3 domain-containing protein
MTLTWKPPGRSDPARSPAYYRIYRKTPGDGRFGLLEAAAGGETGKTLAGQPSGVMLQYQVTAANEGGESPPSNAVITLL